MQPGQRLPEHALPVQRRLGEHRLDIALELVAG
jgi:hypothetical protein